MTQLDPKPSWLSRVLGVFSPSVTEVPKQNPGEFQYSPPPQWLQTRKWVMTPDGVGIVTDLSNYNHAAVMLTDENGENLEQRQYRIDEIRLARATELPQGRAHCEMDDLIRKGYV